MILKPLKASAFAFISLLGLSACSTMSGGPERLEVGTANCEPNAVSQSIRKVRVADQCTRIDWLSGSTLLKGQRNDVITIRMYLIDQNYNDWERGFLNESRTGNFVTTLASLGLSGAGSVTGAGDTSRTLAALNTALTGGKAGFDKEIMLDRTLQILMSKMRANRAKVKELILRRLSTGYAEWPIGLAMADLEAYENAGTLNAALNAIAEDTATDKRDSEKGAEQAIRTTAYDDSAAGQALQDYLETDLTKIDVREANFSKALTAAGAVDIKKEGITQFAYGADPRKKDVLIKLIALETDDPDALKILARGLAN